MSILKELPELVQAGVLDEAAAERIRAHYRNKAGAPANRLLAVFGVLGAVLVGLGIILILAHNWDDLPRGAKTALAFLPLLIGQASCVFTLLKKRDQPAWREGSSSFLFMAVGAAISLVSQIYHLPGNLSDFLLCWMLLCLPLMYVMSSWMASLLYLAGITWYGISASYFHNDAFPGELSYYWLLLPPALPFYYRLCRRQPGSVVAGFHHWFVAASLTLLLGDIAGSYEQLTFVAYMNLFGLFYLLGHLPFAERYHAGANSYRILGSMGSLVLLLLLSFSWFWDDLVKKPAHFGEQLTTAGLWGALLLFAAALLLLLRRKKLGAANDFKPLYAAFLVFAGIFLFGLLSPIAVVLVNLLLLAIGVLTIRQGAQRDHLGLLNYGLLIITLQVICRFLDTDLSFVIRGLLFVAVGVGFFVANYRLLKNRKTHAPS